MCFLLFYKFNSSVTYLENRGCSRFLERCGICQPNFKCRMWHIPHLVKHLQHPRYSRYVTPLEFFKNINKTIYLGRSNLSRQSIKTIKVLIISFIFTSIYITIQVKFFALFLFLKFCFSRQYQNFVVILVQLNFKQVHIIFIPMVE